jgi:peptide/nickel transport system permease protein
LGDAEGTHVVIKLVISRLAALIPLLLAVTFACFLLMGLFPTDPAEQIAGDVATQERIDSLREELGLDRPLHVRYLDWLGDAVRGDLGSSYYSGAPVSDSILQRLPPTLTLAIAATAVSAFVGIGAAVAASLRPGGAVDRAVTVVASLLLAAPPFWAAMLLVILFSLQLGWFPATGWTPFGESVSGWLRSLAIPTLALSLASSAVVARQCRASLAVVLRADHVRAAQARGCSPRQVVMRHGLRNALSPTVTVIGLQMTALLGGALVAEQVFAIPGLGSLAVGAVGDQDLPVVLGIVVVSATVVVLVNLLVDIVYGLLNPRVRPA